MKEHNDIEEDIRKLLSYTEEELKEGLNIHQYKNRNQAIPLSKEEIIKFKNLRKWANNHSKRCIEGQKKWRTTFKGSPGNKQSAQKDKENE